MSVQDEQITALPREFQALNARTRGARERAGRAGRWNLDLELGAKPAYVPLGYHITCVPDPIYGWPLEQVRMIRREYDPGFVPLFRRLVYQAPSGGLVTFIHHGVGRAVRHSRPDPALLGIALPTGWRFERPTMVERWFEPSQRLRVPGSARAKNNLPMWFQPWGDWVQRWAAETFWAATAEEKLRFADEHGEAAEKRAERKHEEAEADYKDQAEQKYRAREEQNLTPEDLSLIRGLSTGAVKPETKPFVSLAKTGADK